MQAANNAGAFKYVEYEQGFATPQLANMYVEFKNAGDESLRESRTFAEGLYGTAVMEPVDQVQFITGEELKLVSNMTGESTYTNSWVFDGGVVSDIQYDVEGDTGGITYMSTAGDADPVEILNVAFYEADDEGMHDAYGSSENFNDIWDALRVNAPDPSGDAPWIGNKNLEIAIDEQGAVFSQPIDVIYIPMSRMLWKDKLPQPQL
jgi:hypothetical protein